jgi:hypothetical protein
MINSPITSTITMSRILIVLLSVMIWHPVAGQITGGTVRGSFESNFQYYQDDEKLGINDSTLSGRRTAMNAYANLLYSSNNFEAGVRYEYYAPPLNGIDPRYEGMGVAHRYIRYFDENLDITAGNYYEQFGNGILFRSYQDWTLGYDNSMDGLRIRLKPLNGLSIKLITGVQRYYWDTWSKEDDRGILNGADLEFDLNTAFKRFYERKTKVTLGISALTRYQQDKHPIYKMPRNTAGFSGRTNISRGNFTLLGEYAYKINDPSADNGLIYKPGEALYFQGSYSVSGFSFSLAGKRLDNMSFRSDRNAGLNDLMINYLPAINKQHIYTLPSKYPYATQPNGEMGFMGSLGYKIKRGTTLGGKYGTDLSLNIAWITDIVREPLNDNTPLGTSGTQGYTSKWFAEGDKYFEDISLELQRRLTKDVKITILYSWICYNIGVIEGHVGEEDVVSHHAVADLTWKLKNRRALRFEAQHLKTHQDEGNKVFGAFEFTARGFFASLQNVWNYGHPESEKQLHYLMISAGYAKNATRFAASYGRQEEGIVCIGGVCQFVPATSGFSLTITTSF